MITRFYGWGWAAIGVVLMAAAVQAAPSDSQAEVRIELRGDDSTGPVPQVRMWVNGKEVTGDKATLGEGGRLRIERRPGTEEKGSARERPGPQAFLGLKIEPLREEAREAAEINGGVLVTEVMPGSPADRAGVKVEDIITAVNGRAAESPRELQERVRACRPGDNIRLAWSRGTKRMEANVALGAYAEAGAGGEEAEKPKPERAGEAFLGVWAVPLTKEAEEHAGTGRGVLVSSLAVDGPAAKAGLQAGDVIVSMDGKDVEAPDQLVDRLRSHKPGDDLRIAYYRAGKRNEVTVRLADRLGELGRKEGPPGFEIPEGLGGNLSDLLEKLGPEIREWVGRLREGPQGRRPGTPVPIPEAPRMGPPAEPYDMGKDMGRILERLDRIEKRLNDLDQRLRKLEK